MAIGIGFRHFGRIREIFGVVFEYGFGYAVEQFGLGGYLRFGWLRRPSRHVARLSLPRRIRLALSQLGPTFIKLGQILSARGDILPAAIVQELRRLQDEGPVVPFDDIRTVIERELGRPIEQCFAEIDHKPLSSASLGQVHAARLKDGREVTVKVLRPGVRRTVETDLQIMADFAVLVTRQVQSFQRYNLPAFVRRFASQVEDEMSYTIEAYNSGRIKDSLNEAGIDVHIPEVLWELTSREVLTTERVRGHRVDRVAIEAPHVDRTAAAEQVARAVLHQIFVTGFFHGDPHHGNILIEDSGAVIMLDFGIVGYIDPRSRRLLDDAIRRVYQQDIDGLIEVMSELGSMGSDTDMQSLRNEVADIVGRFVLLPRKDFPIGDLLMRTLRALWVNNVHLPSELAVTAKALLYGESVAGDLDPNFDLRALAEKILTEERTQELAARALIDRTTRTIESAARRLSHLPERLDRVLALIEQGGLRVKTEDEIEGRWGRVGRVLNRLGLSFLTVGFLIAGTLFLVIGRHTSHVGLGMACLFIAFVIALIIVVQSLRPGQL